MVRTEDTNIVVIPLTVTGSYRFVLAATTSKATVQSLCAACLPPGVTPGLGRWDVKIVTSKYARFNVAVGLLAMWLQV